MSELQKKLAKKHGVEPESIIITGGSTEALKLSGLAVANQSGEVIAGQPTFLALADYAKSWGATVKWIPVDSNKGYDLKSIEQNISNKTKMIFLCNPNNPTGTYLKKNEILELRKKLRSNILLVVDDAYDEYMRKKDYTSGLKLFKKSKNVIILRTFSKIYGLAALRVGWGYGPKKIINGMNNIKPPFNVNKVAQLSAVAALNDKNFINKSVKHNLIWGNKIRKILNQLSMLKFTHNTTIEVV